MINNKEFLVVPQSIGYTALVLLCTQYMYNKRRFSVLQTYIF